MREQGDEEVLAGNEAAGTTTNSSTGVRERGREQAWEGARVGAIKDEGAIKAPGREGGRCVVKSTCTSVSTVTSTMVMASVRLILRIWLMYGCLRIRIGISDTTMVRTDSQSNVAKITMHITPTRLAVGMISIRGYPTCQRRWRAAVDWEQRTQPGGRQQARLGRHIASASGRLLPVVVRRHAPE